MSVRRPKREVAAARRRRAQQPAPAALGGLLGAVLEASAGFEPWRAELARCLAADITGDGPLAARVAAAKVLAETMRAPGVVAKPADRLDDLAARRERRRAGA